MHEGTENAVQPSVQGIAKKAKGQKKCRCRNLFGMLNEENLRNCWREVRKDAGLGWME